MSKPLAKAFADMLLEEDKENISPGIGEATTSSLTPNAGGNQPELVHPQEEPTAADSSLAVLPTEKILMDERAFRVRHGTGIVLLHNIHYGLPAATLINTFKKYGPLVSYMVRYIETTSGIRGIAGVIFKSKIHAATAVNELAPYFEEDEITLTTTHSPIKLQEYAVRVMAICSCFDDYEYVPMNTLPSEDIYEAVLDFVKLMDLSFD